MTISIKYPSIKPTLVLDFARSKVLDPRITFTRSGTATYYDGKTFATSEQNLIYPSIPATAAWSLSSSTATSNSTTAPDGTNTATLLTAAAGTGLFPRTYPGTTTGVTGLSYVASIYAKVGTVNYLQIAMLAGSI